MSHPGAIPSIQNIYHANEIFKTPKYLESLKSQTAKYLTSTPVNKVVSTPPLEESIKRVPLHKRKAHKCCVEYQFHGAYETPLSGKVENID